jgi:hypothetical protein
LTLEVVVVVIVVVVVVVVVMLHVNQVPTTVKFEHTAPSRGFFFSLQIQSRTLVL